VIFGGRAGFIERLSSEGEPRCCHISNSKTIEPHMPPPAEGLASRLFLTPALRAQPDRRLVALVREGYETAFEEIVRRYGKPLGLYAASIVGGRSEDVLQDAFAKALPALCRDDAEIDLRPWLFRIVRNTALNELRDNPPSPEVLAETVAGGGNPAEETERREELADLIRRLRALPERQRAAIVMRELEGLGHAEIAAALGLSDGAARQAIHRARLALRDGAGMLIPLPLLQALMGGGPAVETATGMGAAGLGAGAAGAGAGMALKATAATVLVAGAVGAGVALQHGPRGGPAAAPPAASADQVDGATQATGSPTGGDGRAGDRGEGQGGRHGGGEDRARSAGGGDSGGGSGEASDHHSGPGESGQNESGSSGPGGGGVEGHDSSGPGPEPESGSGESGSGSGSGSSGGSGSGSGSGENPPGEEGPGGGGGDLPLSESGSGPGSGSGDLRDSSGSDGLSG
jgi:RNA polymerase sigma factor (sigma-70 family)